MAACYIFRHTTGWSCSSLLYEDLDDVCPLCVMSAPCAWYVPAARRIRGGIEVQLPSYHSMCHRG
eukprot:346697-Prorocentrum_minimum.AAC.1